MVSDLPPDPPVSQDAPPDAPQKKQGVVAQSADLPPDKPVPDLIKRDQSINPKEMDRLTALGQTPEVKKHIADTYGLRPAVKIGDTIHPGDYGDVHDEILNKLGDKKDTWERGFVDKFGKWHSRESAAKLVGEVDGREVGGGQLHSENLIHRAEDALTTIPGSSILKNPPRTTQDVLALAEEPIRAIKKLGETPTDPNGVAPYLTQKALDIAPADVPSTRMGALKYMRDKAIDLAKKGDPSLVKYLSGLGLYTVASGIPENLEQVAGYEAVAAGANKILSPVAKSVMSAIEKTFPELHEAITTPISELGMTNTPDKELLKKIPMDRLRQINAGAPMTDAEKAIYAGGTKAQPFKTIERLRTPGSIYKGNELTELLKRDTPFAEPSPGSVGVQPGKALTVTAKAADKSTFDLMTEIYKDTGEAGGAGPGLPEKDPLAQKRLDENVDELVSRAQKAGFKTFDEIAGYISKGQPLPKALIGMLQEKIGPPPTSRVDSRTIGTQAAEHLSTNYPTMARTIAGKTFPMAPTDLQEAITNAVAAGNEAKINGANPQQADQAALKSFQKQIASKTAVNAPGAIQGVTGRSSGQNPALPPSPAQNSQPGGVSAPPTSVPPAPPSVPPSGSGPEQPSRRLYPKQISEKYALRRSLQRQAAAALEGASGENERMTKFKTDLADIIKDALPETERGVFLTRLAKADTPTDGLKLLADVQQKARAIEQTGGRKFTEAQALRRSLQRQAQTAIESTRAERLRLTDLKKSVANEIQTRFALADRGRFLNLVARTNNFSDVYKAIDYMDKESERVQNRDMDGLIKNLLTRTMNSKVIDIDYLDKIKNLTQDILFQKPSPATVKRLMDTQDFIDRQRADGKDVTVPQYVMDRLSKLSGRPLKDMTLAEKENLVNEIQALRNQGATKLNLERNLEAKNLARDAQDIASNTYHMQTHELATAPMGERTSLVSKFADGVKKALDLKTHVAAYANINSVLYDQMDGNVGRGTGPLSKVFKARIDGDYLAYDNENYQIQKQIESAAKISNIKERSMSSYRVGIYATALREGGMERLYHSFEIKNGVPHPITKMENLTDTEMEKRIKDVDNYVNNLKLTPQEKSFLAAGQKIHDNLGPRAARVMRDVYNEDMALEENYTPFVLKRGLMPEDSEQTIREFMREAAPRRQTGTERGFTKATVKKHGIPLDLDYVKNLKDSADKHLYFIHMEKDLKYMSKLLKGDFITKAKGDITHAILKDHLDIVARKGGQTGGLQTKWLKVLRNNIGFSTIFWKPATALIHAVPGFLSVPIIGHHFFGGMMDFITLPETRTFLKENFPVVRKMIGDPAFTEFSDNRLNDALAKAGKFPLSRCWTLSAGSTAIGAYNKYLADHHLPLDYSNPNADAIRYAEDVVVRTHGSAEFKDAMLGKYLRDNRAIERELYRTFLMYQTPRMANYRMLTHEMWDLGFKKAISPGVGFGERAKAAGHGVETGFWASLVMAAQTGIYYAQGKLMGKYIGETSRHGQDSFEKAAILKALEINPFMSPLVSALYYHSSGVPLFQPAELGLKGLKGILGKKAKAKEKASVDIAQAAGEMFGFSPAGLAANIARRVINVNRTQESGEEREPEERTPEERIPEERVSE